MKPAAIAGTERVPLDIAPRERRHAAIPTATARSFAILELVAHAPTAVDVGDVIEALSLPKATAYRLVEGLLTAGYLTREPARKRLTVGHKFTDMALGVMRASMRDSARHAVLRRLARVVNETCNIGIILNGEVVYLDRVEAEHWPLRLHFGAGSRVPLHASAIGKLHIALAPSRVRRALLRSVDLQRFTPSTITDRGAFEEELKRIRKERVSFDHEEFLAGVICAAVPIIRKTGELVAGVAVQAPTARLSPAQARKHLPALQQAAAELSELLGSTEVDANAARSAVCDVNGSLKEKKV